MSVRNAAFSDIPRIVLLLEEGFSRTHYAKSGLGGIDRAEAKRLLTTAVHRHGHKTGGGTFIQVSEKDGAIEGLILGTLARVYSIGDRLMATDLFWSASERVPPADPFKLMKNMVEWAWSCPDVVEVTCGTTAIIQDPEAAGRMLERLGLTRYGVIWRGER